MSKRKYVVAVVPWLRGVLLFVTPWTAAWQASLSFTIFWSLLKFMSIESMMPFNHFILWHPLLLLCSVFPSTRVFSSKSVLHIGWPKWSFSFSISPFNEYSGLISFRIVWFDILAVQGTLKSFLQHHSTKTSIFPCSTLFMACLLNLEGCPKPWWILFQKHVCVLVAQLCLTDSAIPYSVHGILPARILEWFAIPFSRGFSQSSNWTQVSCIPDRFFTAQATRSICPPYSMWTTQKKKNVFLNFYHLYISSSKSTQSGIFRTCILRWQPIANTELGPSPPGWTLSNAL